MNKTVLIWSFIAVLLFWGVGAYNRLVRLRALAIASFVPLQLKYGPYTALVQSHFEMQLGANQLSARSGLINAALEFEASLKTASTQPLDSLVMRALETARQVLQSSWDKVCAEPQDLAGEQLMQTLLKQWDDISTQVQRDKAEYLKRIQEYNQSIEQFPAKLLAWLFRFEPAFWDQEAT